MLAALHSVVGASLFEPRNLIASWPGLALSVGLLATRAGRVAGVAVAVLALAAVSIGGIRMLKAQNRRPDYGSAARFIDRTGSPGDPVVETPLFPNPLSPLDAALGYASPSSERHPVLRIGAAQREAKVGALERGPSPLAPLPVLSTRAVAARAVALSRRGRLFVVALRPQAGAVDGFLRALGRSYRVVATRRLPGPRVLLGPQPTTLDVTVLVLQRVRESPPLGRTRGKG